MKPFSKKILNTCKIEDRVFDSIGLDRFGTITVYPIPSIHDNIHEEDPAMISATMQQFKYHKERLDK